MNKQHILPFSIKDNTDIEYNAIHRDLATFKSGLTKEIHSWFRLTPSFGADLVRLILKEFSYNKESIILDPFAGVATTLIECKLLGLKSYGFEINPFLFNVGEITLNWKLSLENLKEISSNIQNLFNIKKIFLNDKNCKELPCEIPPIHNIHRWWREDVLKDLLILKMAINEATNDFGKGYQKFFYLCLAAVLIPDLTNVTLGKLQLHFIDRTNDEINVFKTFNNHLTRMINDYKVIEKLNNNQQATIFNIDATDLNGIVIDEKIDFVITSPPYPNRYSYVWNTRPFLYFFDYFTKPNEASNLDKKTIGGTWGTATSVLAKGIIEPLNEAIDKYVTPITDEIRINDNLMANYIMKYFNLLSKQVITMDKLLTPNAKIAYVVGNSRIKGIYVETDKLLSNIIKSLNIGYKKTRINRFRKRNSGKDLFESIVYGEK